MGAGSTPWHPLHTGPDGQQPRDPRWPRGAPAVFAGDAMPLRKPAVVNVELGLSDHSNGRANH